MATSKSEPRSQTDDTKYVGKPVPRVDAPAKVTGKALYTMDLQPGHLLHAKLVTSTVPHARLTRVDTTEAEALDGVVAVATGADAPDTRRGAFIYDQPILAKGKVRYVGEPIALVAAETEAIAERAAGLVDVEYERLDPVFDLDDAFSRNPTGIVHENVREYEFGTGGDPRYGKRGHVSDEDADRPNLLYKDGKEAGDVEAAFEEADVVVEHEYEVKPFQHCSMEPHVAIAHAHDDAVSIWTSQQVPHNIEKKIGMEFPDLDSSKIRVVCPYVGGGFGGKITDFLEAMLVVIARMVNRPVRLALTRAEEFTTGISRPQVKTWIKDGVTDDGELVAREAKVTFNCGAYNEQVFRAAVSATDQVYGAYNIPNLRFTSYAVYTNLPKFGAFRGFGKSEVNWAVERHMDRTAKRLGIDPLEYRLKNLLREGDTNPMGDLLGPNDTEGCLQWPAARVGSVDVDAEFPDYSTDEWCIGVGYAYAVKSIAQAAGSATLKVRSGTNIELHIGASDIGQGSDTAFTQIAAEEFGVDTAQIDLVTGDTARTPYNRGPTGSRFTYHTGNAIRKAADQAKQSLFEEAAMEFDENVDPEDLATEDGRVYVQGDPDRSISVDDIFSTYDQEVGVSRTMLKRSGELIGSATFDARGGRGTKVAWTPIGQAALVAVNTLTGQAEVLRFATACDVGRSINPKMVEQQLEGGAGQGISSALYEEIVFDDGHVVNPNFKDYRIPSATELPHHSETKIIESVEESGPYGAKGVGEAGVLPAAPAVGNAIVNALGVEFDVLPVTPERIVATQDDK